MMCVKKTCSENILIKNKFLKSFKDEDNVQDKYYIDFCDSVYDNKSYIKNIRFKYLI